jgi:hypothetical protein
MTDDVKSRAARWDALALAVAVAALCIGLALHAVAVWLRDSGPAWDGVSLKGNGALIVLLVAAALLVAGELVALSRRSWLGMLLIPAALFAGLFVVAGGI